MTTGKLIGSLWKSKQKSSEITDYSDLVLHK